MAENPNTQDPEYNSEAIHSDEAPWFTQEAPADETYHPHDEELIHEYAPQEREAQGVGVPAITPLVNTGGEYEPDPYNPAPEEGCFHVTTYGTVEDVAFADDPESRRTGLVSLSVRDEMDDLIHTDLHTLNPLSLLSETNVKIGDRVRVDIQDYKSVIEWFVYNYPTLLKELDLLTTRTPDGPWFSLNGQNWKGGSISDEPSRFTPHQNITGEDWENQKIGSQLDKSYIEIGQRDGNKKITLRQFLTLVGDYFQIPALWTAVRDHEKRLVQLERDLRTEDVERDNRIEKTIDISYYAQMSRHSNWEANSPDHQAPSYFVGNIEQKQFCLYVNYVDAMNESVMGAENWFSEKEADKGGRAANKIFNAGAIPEEFRPSKFQWVQNYGYCDTVLDGWWNIITKRSVLDFGFDPDGSVWVSNADLETGKVKRSELGIFGTSGDPDHMWWVGIDSKTKKAFLHWNIEVKIASFGGVINIGTGGQAW